MKQPDLNKLQQTLQSTGIQQSNNALFQVISQLIKAVKQLQDSLNETIASIIANITNINISGTGGKTIIREFESEENTEVIMVPFSGTTFNQNSGYWTLLTDGDVDETDFIFANGDAISVFVPTP